ncbi:MAG: hypothetical protein PUB22_00030 [Clostridiales bacterium]|nr:hypothetical protein [Clostridiales bacterium]
MDLLQYLCGKPEQQKEFENGKNKKKKHRKMIEIFHVNDIIEKANHFRCIDMVIVKQKHRLPDRAG